MLYSPTVALIECFGRSRRFVARPTEGADHDRLFALAEGYYSGYSRYAANTDGVRVIAVLRLTPARGPWTPAAHSVVGSDPPRAVGVIALNVGACAHHPRNARGCLGHHHRPNVSPRADVTSTLTSDEAADQPAPAVCLATERREPDGRFARR